MSLAKLVLCLPLELILPVCLPPHQLSVKEMLVVTGWGLLKEKGKMQRVCCHLMDNLQL